MIATPKYKGCYVGNKVKVIDLFTKRQKFLPPEEWVMFKGETGQIVPAIVSEELWDAANAVLTKRSEDVKNRQGICNHVNLLTGKLYCTCCDTAYYHRDSVDPYLYKLFATPAYPSTLQLQIKLFNETIIKKTVHKRRNRTSV